MPTVGETDTVPAKLVPLEERDRPNTPSIVKKVLLRDGQVCANPMCGAKLSLHAHHCPLTGLAWKPKCAENDFAFGEELARAGTIAQVHVSPTHEPDLKARAFCRVDRRRASSEFGQFAHWARNVD